MAVSQSVSKAFSAFITFNMGQGLDPCNVLHQLQLSGIGLTLPLTKKKLVFKQQLDKCRLAEFVVMSKCALLLGQAL